MTAARKKGRGRPPLSRANRRENVVRLRVTDAELRVLHACARMERQSVTQYLRALVLSSTREGS